MCNLNDFFSAANSLRDAHLERANTSHRDLEVETWSQIVAECYSFGKIPKYIELQHSAPINTTRIIKAARDLFRTVSIEIEDTQTTEDWYRGHTVTIYITLSIPYSAA